MFDRYFEGLCKCKVCGAEYKVNSKEYALCPNNCGSIRYNGSVIEYRCGYKKGDFEVKMTKGIYDPEQFVKIDEEIQILIEKIKNSEKKNTNISVYLSELSDTGEGDKSYPWYLSVEICGKDNLSYGGVYFEEQVDFVNTSRDLVVKKLEALLFLTDKVIADKDYLSYKNLKQVKEDLYWTKKQREVWDYTFSLGIEEN